MKQITVTVKAYTLDVSVVSTAILLLNDLAKQTKETGKLVSHAIKANVLCLASAGDKPLDKRFAHARRVTLQAFGMADTDKTEKSNYERVRKLVYRLSSDCIKYGIEPASCLVIIGKEVDYTESVKLMDSKIREAKKLEKEALELSKETELDRLRAKLAKLEKASKTVNSVIPVEPIAAKPE